MFKEKTINNRCIMEDIETLATFAGKMSAYYHKRKDEVRENWLKGCRSPSSYKYNAETAAYWSHVQREALFQYLARNQNAKFG